LEEEKLRRKYVIYENLLVDVTNFYEHHPGGRNLIKDNLYLDVGRYLTGTQGYSSGINPNTHNYWTVKYMIQKLAYAEIIQTQDILTSVIDSSHHIEKYLKVNAKYEIAKNTFEYKFHDNDFKFHKFIPGHRWLGRHFSISHVYLAKTRYYTTCITLDKVYKKKINILLDNAIKGYCHTKGMLFELHERTANHISFYIKRYKEPEALSNALYDESAEFKIKGPFVNKS
jgi:hypothetical protein